MLLDLSNLIHQSAVYFLILNAKVSHRYSRAGMVIPFADDLKTYPVNSSLDISPRFAKGVGPVITPNGSANSADRSPHRKFHIQSRHQVVH